eukprot:jgi/Psemu1/290687/fgenesh1_pg.541_\
MNGGNEGSSSSSSKWRSSRRNQFERLDGDEDDVVSLTSAATYQLQSNSISSSWGSSTDPTNTYSNANTSAAKTQSNDSGVHRVDASVRDRTMTSPFPKRTPIKNSNSNSNSNGIFSPIKPPVKDTSLSRGPGSEKKTPLKKQKQHNTGGELDWGGTGDNFSNINEAINMANNDSFFGSMAVSRQPSSANKTSTNPASLSDPTDFFSKEPTTTTLTISNLAKMDSSFVNSGDANTEKNSAAMDGMERLVKERKFYQFTIDEDKASTVVESTLQLPIDYPHGNDDYTEFSCSHTSQGTRIQQRSKSSDHPRTSDASEVPGGGGVPSTSRNEVKEFDPFFQQDNNNNNTKTKGDEKQFDAFFSQDTKTDDFFPDFAGNQPETTRCHKLALATESDLSSSWGDAYFERSFKSSTEFNEPPPSQQQTRRSRIEERYLQQISTKSVSSHQVSTKSLTYSPSPVNNNKRNSVVTPTQNGRQPLTLKNTQSSGGKKSPFPSSYAKKHDWGSENANANANEKDSSEFKFDELSPYNRPRRNQYINDDYMDDDNRSAGGFSVERKASRPSRPTSSSGSYTKPLALPSNAIVGSMLFRTHHDIDQNDVEEKLNKFDEENSKEKEIRHLHGDIPDSVHADSDHMTTVSSFSDATSAYLYDSWRKPTRDLTSHFSSARALDTMDYHGARRGLHIRQSSQQMVDYEPSGLFEA